MTPPIPTQPISTPALTPSSAYSAKGRSPTNPSAKGRSEARARAQCIALRQNRRAGSVIARDEDTAGEHDLDAAIAGAAIGRGVVGDRPARAMTLHLDARGRDSQRHEVIADADGSPQRKLVVGDVRPDVVGVPLDGEAKLRIGRHYP